ncbi:hypothetical protein [Actinoplanes derwentensis]|uniref:Uncharacterized protein n=1 Tax=Actinoplanes derwentensis TaxID=113562 RepID=A0A1H2CVP6_9ACTN|nr:hypothetical protein [Actinoplanes derwentensis]GID82005.1 hypothetical protein Ade03nite_09290 [Actinoplanes derwentensis]SDT74337.1 hypothetical protein SAMN04489716_6951 [Actinoplanes derwentensis]
MDDKTVELMGNLGDFVGGFSALALAIAALVAGPSVWRDLRDRLKAQRDLAKEQAKDIRLERDRNFFGWMPGALSVYQVKNVEDPHEIALAAAELTDNQPSAYVLVKAENSAQIAYNLRLMIAAEGHLAKPPTRREREILENAKPAPPQRSFNDSI